MNNILLSANDLSHLPKSDTMPVLFVGHGNPMNAIENNTFSENWTFIGKMLPRPKAILCISAHWETQGTFVTSSPWPETIHDFYGFPQDLFNVKYPAPGNPILASEIAQAKTTASISLSEDWGLDHGCWSILVKMYPAADIPVLQLSLDHFLSPEKHFSLAKELDSLRDRGVLIIGSGNLVHNLRFFDFHNPEKQYDWALSMNEKFKQLVLSGDSEALLFPQRLGPGFSLAAPTLEHFIPILYPLALRRKKDDIFIFNDALVNSLSMTSFLFHSKSLTLE